MSGEHQDKSIDELLTAIDNGASQEHSYQSSDAINVMLPPFARLLVRLNEDAKNTGREVADTANKTLTFTKWLFWATIVLLVVTCLLFGLELVKLYETRNSDPKPDKTQHDGSNYVSRLPPPTAQQPKGMEFLK